MANFNAVPGINPNTPGIPRGLGAGGINTAQGAGTGYGGAELTPEQFRASFGDQVYNRQNSGIQKFIIKDSNNVVDRDRFKISNVKQALTKYNVQKINLFSVIIKNAGKLGRLIFKSYNFSERDLVLLCYDVTLPGVGLYTTNDYKRYGVGFQEQVPYGAAFNEITLRFIGDGQGHVLSFFETWMNLIVPFANAHDITASQPTSSSGLWEPGEVGYKKDFQTDISIEMYNTAGGVVDKYTLHKAFPVSLRDADLSWNAQNENSMMSVISQFSFLNWKSERFEAANNIGASLPGLSFIQRLLKLGSIYSTFSAVGIPDSIADIIQVYNNTNIISRNRTTLF